MKFFVGGSHFTALTFKVSMPYEQMHECMHAQLCLTLWNLMDCSPPGSSVHEDSPGKNTEVSCHTLIQGIFPTQRSNSSLLCLLHLLIMPPGKPECMNTHVKTILSSQTIQKQAAGCIPWAIACCVCTRDSVHAFEKGRLSDHNVTSA